RSFAHDARQGLAHRTRPERIRKRGVRDHQFPNSRTVKEQFPLSNRFTNALVKNSDSPAQDGLRGIVLFARGEGEGQTRRKIVAVIKICLPTVAQAECEAKVWAHPQLILEEAGCLVL